MNRKTGYRQKALGAPATLLIITKKTSSPSKIEYLKKELKQYKMEDQG